MFEWELKSVNPSNRSKIQVSAPPTELTAGAAAEYRRVGAFFPMLSDCSGGRVKRDVRFSAGFKPS